MKGTMSEWREVKVPASEAWKLYSTLDLAKLVPEALPGLVSTVDIIQGDGAAGTIVQVNFVQEGGTGAGTERGLKSYKEKFTVVDNEKRVKVAEVVEGGYLEMGFTLYRVTLEMIEEEGKENECITRCTIEYEIEEDAAANVALVNIQPLATIMKVAALHLERNYITTTI